MSDTGPLACPRCANKYPLSVSFCPQCEMPLVYAGSGESVPITEVQEKARKVKPQYVGGELVRIAGGRNLSEAELIQGMLLEEGIPSMQRRAAGADVPDFLAAGRRDIMVPEAGYDAARALLGESEQAGGPGPAQVIEQGENPLRLLIGMAAAIAIAAVIVLVLLQLTS